MRRILFSALVALAPVLNACTPPDLPPLLQYAETEIYERATRKLDELKDKADDKKAAKLAKIQDLLNLWAEWRANPDAHPRALAKEALHDAAELLGLELLP